MTDNFHRSYDKDDISIYKRIGRSNRKRWLDPNSGYNSEKFKEYLRNRKDAKNPRFNDHRNFIELHGEEKAKQLKKLFSDMRKGRGNANSKSWIFTDPNGLTYNVKG